MTLFKDATNSKMRRKTLSRYDNFIWPHNVIIFSQELSATHISV